MTYEERKIIFIARATRHFDTPEIREEAARMFDEANKERKPNNMKFYVASIIGIFLAFFAGLLIDIQINNPVQIQDRVIVKKVYVNELLNQCKNRNGEFMLYQTLDKQYRAICDTEPERVFQTDINVEEISNQ